jgi:hypothetical protein
VAAEGQRPYLRPVPVPFDAEIEIALVAVEGVVDACRDQVSDPLTLLCQRRELVAGLEGAVQLYQAAGLARADLHEALALLSACRGELAGCSEAEDRARGARWWWLLAGVATGAAAAGLAAIVSR